MSMPRIHGLVMARNEWPVLGLAIAHALEHHVDRVLVLDHASTDGTQAGLERLGRAYGDRLTVVHLGEAPFLQEAATSVAIGILSPRPEDWLYVFDADEFGIAGPQLTLRDMLSGLPASTEAVRYSIHNWVSGRDFVVGSLDSYLTLRHRAIVNEGLRLPIELAADEITHGSLNYFDIPFAPKVIVRGKAAAWIAAGSHVTRPQMTAHVHTIPPERFQVAHTPLLSRDRLLTRGQQGMALAASGFCTQHGWQSQMVAAITSAGGLEDFWLRHSIGPTPTAASGPTPHVVEEDAFVDAIRSTIDRLRRIDPDGWPVVEQTAVAPAPPDADVLVPAALRTIHGLQQLAVALSEDLAAATPPRVAYRGDTDRGAGADEERDPPASTARPNVINTPNSSSSSNGSKSPSKGPKTAGWREAWCMAGLLSWKLHPRPRPEANG